MDTPLVLVFRVCLVPWFIRTSDSWFFTSALFPVDDSCLPLLYLDISVVVLEIGLGLETGLETTFWRSRSRLGIDRILLGLVSVSDKEDSGFISRPVKTTTAGISLNCLFIVWFICSHHYCDWMYLLQMQPITWLISNLKFLLLLTAVTPPRPPFTHSKKVNAGDRRRSCGCLGGDVSQIFCNKFWLPKPQRVHLQNSVQKKTHSSM